MSFDEATCWCGVAAAVITLHFEIVFNALQTSHKFFFFTDSYGGERDRYITVAGICNAVAFFFAFYVINCILNQNVCAFSAASGNDGDLEGVEGC